MAAPDVVCQPCGSALGAPTKECSTAHKTVSCGRTGVGERPRVILRCVTTASRAAVGPLLHCATFVAHRAVTTVRARDVAPRKILVATLTVSVQVRRRQDVAQEGPARRPPGAAHLYPQARRQRPTVRPSQSFERPSTRLPPDSRRHSIRPSPLVCTGASTGSRPSVRCSPRPARAPSCGAR